MGVPGLFSWVRRNFAEVIISDAAWSASHPAVSSLFIDLNHILHAATHPDYPFHEPASREEMLEAVLKYIAARKRLERCWLILARGGGPSTATKHSSVG